MPRTAIASELVDDLDRYALSGLPPAAADMLACIAVSKRSPIVAKRPAHERRRTLARLEA